MSQAVSSQPRSPTPDREDTISAPSSPRARYDPTPAFAMIPLLQLTPSNLPDFTPLVRQSLGPGTPFQSRSRKSYYAVSRGHIRTVVRSWEECQMLTRDHHLPAFRSFDKFADAIEFMRDD